MSLNTISYLTLLLYGIAVWGYCRGLKNIKVLSKANICSPDSADAVNEKSFHKTLYYLLAIITATGLMLHGYTLYKWIDTAQGQNLNWANVLSLVTWLIACFTLLFSIKKPIENLMILILPVTACSVPLVYLFNTPEFYKTGASPGHLFHILCSIISAGILGIAGFQALMLHVQNQALRNKPGSALLRLLPPIETMEKILFQIIWLGFLCLTLSLISALGFASDPYARSHLHKIGLSFLAWGFFAILLYKHYRAGWRGKTAVRWTLGGVLALLVAYFSSKLLF